MSRRRIFLLAILLNIISLAIYAPAEEIEWFEPSLGKALEEARSLDKPLMIDFYTDWCGWCKKLDETAYRDSKVVELSKKFVCLKLDGDREGAEAVKKYRIRGYPTILFLNSSGEEVERVVGYREAADFEGVMREVLESGQSLHELMEVLKAEPNDPEANYLVAMRQLKNEDFSKAIIHLKKVIEADPENSSGYLDEAEFEMLMLRTKDFANQMLPLLIVIERGKTVNLDALARLQESRGPLRFSDSRGLELATSALKVFADYRKAFTEGSEHSKEEAARSVRDVSKEMGEYLAGKFEAFLERFPETEQTEQALNVLWFAYRVAEDREGLFKVYERALKMKGNDARFLHDYARALYEEERDLARARELIQKAYSLEPENASIIDTLACIEFKLGNREKAIELQQKAVSLRPDDENLRKHLNEFKKPEAPSE